MSDLIEESRHDECLEGLETEASRRRRLYSSRHYKKGLNMEKMKDIKSSISGFGSTIPKEIRSSTSPLKRPSSSIHQRLYNLSTDKQRIGKEKRDKIANKTKATDFFPTKVMSHLEAEKLFDRLHEENTVSSSSRKIVRPKTACEIKRPSISQGI